MNTIKFSESSFYPQDIDSSYIFKIALKMHFEILGKITGSIEELANYNINEIQRIKRAYYYSIPKEILLKLKNNGAAIEFDAKTLTDKEPSIVEMALSLGYLEINEVPRLVEMGDIKGMFYALTLASECFGVAMGSEKTDIFRKIEKTFFYKEAAFKRHAEHHAIKADAMKYYADNIDSFKSMDQAAEKIAGKIVPASFRTVRKWITEYHKNLRSAGKT